MNENETEVLDSTNETETTEIVGEVEKTEEIDVEALKKENETLKAQKEHWRKKAEDKPEPKVQIKGLSDEDLLYVARANIHKDDVKDVVEIAKLKKIAVEDAHKFMTPILAERDEERKTALATQTKGGARGASADSPEDIIAKAQAGKLSEDDIEKLAEAEMKIKLAKIQK